MNVRRSCVLAARWIIPVSSPPIKGGWIRLIEGTVAEVGSGNPPSKATDLGDVAILPRLVNAHTHLEFSDLEHPIGHPGIALAQWIGQVIRSRQARSPADCTTVIERGLAELWQGGAGLVGEIATPPASYPKRDGVPEIVAFAEVLGLSRHRADERLALALKYLRSDHHGAISPHAPYSISREALSRSLRLAKRLDCAVAMHVAESPEERELLTRGTGSLAEALSSLGVWQDGLFPWGPDPFGQLIQQLASAKSALLVHGNDLQEAEIDQLRAHANVTVVYCPRTHAFFRFSRHPVHKLLKAKIRVALGTDSRASNPDLSLWSEVQFLLQNRTDLDPAAVIRMATRSGAEALGSHGRGSIEASACGELGCVRTQATNLEQLYRDFSVESYNLMDAIG